MYSNTPILNKKIRAIIQKIKQLSKVDRYRGAFIFGSIARGEFHKNSDIDLQLLIKGKEHPAVNHIFIDGIKVDISFNSLKNLTDRTKEEIKNGRRIPMIAESIILFDKDNNLHKLKAKASKIDHPEVKKEDILFNEYMIYNDDKKVTNSIKGNQETALLVMHTSLKNLLEIHYKKNNHWFVSNKRIFADLHTWDNELEQLLREFVKINNVNEKYKFWSKMVDHVLKGFGGRKVVEDFSCKCKICKKDLELVEHTVNNS